MLRILGAAYSLTLIARVADLILLLVVFGKLQLLDVATFGVASAVASFFGIWVDGGLSALLSRDFANGRVTLRQGVLFAIKLRLQLLLIGAFAALAYLSLKDASPALSSCVLLACATQLFVSAENLCGQWLRANRKQVLANSLATLDSVLKAVALTLLSLFCAKVAAVNVFAVQFAYHLLLLPTMLVATYRNRRLVGERRAPDECLIQANTGYLLKGCFSFAFISWMTILQNRADWLLLEGIAGPAEFAQYSLANRAYETVMAIISTGAITIFPVIAANYRDAKNSHSVKMATTISLLIGALAAGLAAVLVPALINLLWPGKYPEAGEFSAALLPLACISTLCGIAYYDLMASGRTRSLVVIVLISAVVQISFDVWAIPRFHGLGAIGGMYLLNLANLAGYSFAMRSDRAWLAVMLRRFGFSLLCAFAAIGLLSLVEEPLLVAPAYVLAWLVAILVLVGPHYLKLLADNSWRGVRTAWGGLIVR